MLTWQSNVPRFVAQGFVGDRMTLFFGSTNIDDIAIAEFYFVIELCEQDGAWSISTEWHQCGERTRKPNMRAFLSALNKALKAHKDFDFGNYWQVWSLEDPDFAVVIRNTSGDCQKAV